MKLRRIVTILVKEFQELFRDGKMRAVVFFAPLIQILIFGYAATYDIREIPTAVLDRSNSTLSRRLVNQLESSGYFKIQFRLQSPAQIDTLMANGSVWCAVDIPVDFGEQIAGGNQAALGVSIDAVNSNSATITAGYLSGVIARLNDELIRERAALLSAAPVRTATVENRVRILYNPDLESRNFNVPAIIVQILVVVTLLLTSMAIVKEKEFGTMEQLAVTPIRSSELIIGKALPYAFIGMVDITLICTVAVFYFRVPLLGSLTLLFATSLAFMMSTLAVGLLISIVSKTQQQAMMTSFFFMMPAILLSGFAFPIENMPESIQYFTYLNPLRYFVVIIRAIFLKGATTTQLVDQIVPLVALGVGTLALSAIWFRKRTR
ncbi:MAG: ABC transporter permease [candidate division Zixibacteria bacterium]|nr:ABC transporter permease [candidate division Zixibacteria bacterium]